MIADIATAIGGKHAGAYGALAGLYIGTNFELGKWLYNNLKESWYRWPSQFNNYLNFQSGGYYQFFVGK